MFKKKFDFCMLCTNDIEHDYYIIWINHKAKIYMLTNVDDDGNAKCSCKLKIINK